MDFIRAIILGIIQAVTEFLPISSSAHLILFRDWLGFESTNPLTFDVALHVGTLAAVVIYFRREVGKLVGGAVSSLRTRDFSSSEHRLPWFIAAATLPAALAGGLLESYIEEFVRTPWVIVGTLTVGGILFIIADRAANAQRSVADVRFGQALLIGVAQSIALVPGVSRSGITIITGMWQGLKRDEAARFSFLLSIPIMLGAGAKKALDLTGVAMTTQEVLVVLVGMVTSAVFGWLVIRWLLGFLAKNRLHAFAYYRFALALVIVVWLVAR